MSRKNIFAALLTLTAMFSLAACSNSTVTETSGSKTIATQTEQNTKQQTNNSEAVLSTDDAESEEVPKLTVTINGKEFAAALEDTQAAEELTEMLPLTLSMQEMNGNEKYGDLPKSLTQEIYSPGEIHAGDILLWGADTLVIFYESFSTSYSYTAIGHIDDPSGIAEAAGSGNAKVTITLN